MAREKPTSQITIPLDTIGIEIEWREFVRIAPLLKRLESIFKIRFWIDREYWTLSWIPENREQNQEILNALPPRQSSIPNIPEGLSGERGRSVDKAWRCIPLVRVGLHQRWLRFINRQTLIKGLSQKISKPVDIRKYQGIICLCIFAEKHEAAAAVFKLGLPFLTQEGRWLRQPITPS